MSLINVFLQLATNRLEWYTMEFKVDGGREDGTDNLLQKSVKDIDTQTNPEVWCGGVK